MMQRTSSRAHYTASPCLGRSLKIPSLHPPPSPPPPALVIMLCNYIISKMMILLSLCLCLYIGTFIFSPLPSLHGRLRKPSWIDCCCYWLQWLAGWLLLLLLFLVIPLLLRRSAHMCAPGRMQQFEDLFKKSLQRNLSLKHSDYIMKHSNIQSRPLRRAASPDNDDEEQSKRRSRRIAISAAVVWPSYSTSIPNNLNGMGYRQAR